MSDIYSYGLRPDASFDEKAEWLNVRRHRPAYFVGLDLGQSQDFSALCVMERTGESRASFQFACTYLHRWKLRTPYPTIVSDTVRLMNKPELQSGPQRPTLAIDATGVGAPVIDLFKREKHNSKLEPIQIVGGSNVSRENGVTRVPKRNLVSTVQVCLQSKRLKIASQLPEADTLTRELQNFQVKITDSANDTYGAWREGTHDDLILAAALSLWTATEVQTWSAQQFRFAY
jgi:hypothetical protein